MSLDKWLWNFAKRRTVPVLGTYGESRTVGGNTVTVFQVGTTNYVTLCSGTTVPTNASADFAKGCIFIKTDAGTGDAAIYQNLGSTTSCLFMPITPAPYVPANAAVTAKNATDTTVAVAEWSGLNVTNTGASGTIALTLPTAATMIGVATRVQITVAQIVQILPQTGEKIFLGGSGVASKYLAIAGVVGNYCDIYCDGTDFLVTGYSGVVTKEG